MKKIIFKLIATVGILGCEEAFALLSSTSEETGMAKSLGAIWVNDCQEGRITNQFSKEQLVEWADEHEASPQNIADFTCYIMLTKEIDEAIRLIAAAVCTFVWAGLFELQDVSDPEEEAKCKADRDLAMFAVNNLFKLESEGSTVQKLTDYGMYILQENSEAEKEGAPLFRMLSDYCKQDPGMKGLKALIPRMEYITEAPEYASEAELEKREALLKSLELRASCIENKLKIIDTKETIPSHFRKKEPNEWPYDEYVFIPNAEDRTTHFLVKAKDSELKLGIVEEVHAEVENASIGGLFIAIGQDISVPVVKLPMLTINKIVSAIEVVHKDEEEDATSQEEHIKTELTRVKGEKKTLVLFVRQVESQDMKYNRYDLDVNVSKQKLADSLHIPPTLKYNALDEGIEYDDHDREYKAKSWLRNLLVPDEWMRREIEDLEIEVGIED